MLKKALIEVALRSNLLVMDFTKHINRNDLLISAKGAGSHYEDSSNNQKSL
jgi:hypothetical protein